MPSPVSKHDLKIVIYEPFGSGGICHYTFLLANAVARSGATVTVVTAAPYELEALPRYFSLNTQLSQTCIGPLLRRLLRRHKVEATEQARISSTNPGPTHSEENLSGILLAVRRWLIWLEFIVYSLMTRPTAVHLQWLSEPCEDQLFVRLLRLLGFTLIYTAHNVLPHTSYSTREVKAFSTLYHAVDRIIVHSESIKQNLVDAFQLKPSKLSVIPIGSFDLFYSANPIRKDDARTALGIAPDKRVVLFFGLIRRYKGLEYLVSAFDEVSRHVKDSLLVIAGSIPRDDPEEYAYYSSLIDGLRTRTDVICKQEWMSWNNIGQYFVACDVVALPYVHTYMSGILLAAYAAGRPVVATDTGGIREVVEHGKSGFLVPVKDAESMATALRAVLDDPDLQMRMGRYAAELAEQKYSWMDIAARTTALYRSAVSPADRNLARTL